MDEAKSLANMAITAMISAVVLAAAFGLVQFSYRIWGALEKQDTINKEMHEYTKYAPYDRTIVKGQEIMSLINETNGDPWIIIYGLGEEYESKGKVYDTTSGRLYNARTANPKLVVLNTQLNIPISNYSSSTEYCPGLTNYTRHLYDSGNPDINIRKKDLRYVTWVSDDVVSMQSTEFPPIPSTYASAIVASTMVGYATNPRSAYTTAVASNRAINDSALSSWHIANDNHRQVIDMSTFHNKEVKRELYNKLSEWFLNRGRFQTRYDRDDVYDMYVDYESFIVYAGPDSNDIIGLIFLELDGKKKEEGD